MDRRIMLGGLPWSPASARPIAWYYAAGQYVSLNGATVSAWADRMLAGSDVIQATPALQPTWEGSGGWGSGKPSIRSALQSLTSPSGGAAPIESVFSGLNKPFTILVTCQILNYTGTVAICSWNGGAGTTQTCDVTAGQLMSSTRTDSGSSNTVTASANLVGSGHVRLAYSFGGDLMTMHLNTLQVASSSIVGGGGASVAWTSFTIASVRDMRITELIAVPRALSAAEVALYYAYSLNEWGA